jgi:hypothetical protein
MSPLPQTLVDQPLSERSWQFTSARRFPMQTLANLN